MLKKAAVVLAAFSILLFLFSIVVDQVLASSVDDARLRDRSASPQAAGACNVDSIGLSNKVLSEQDVTLLTVFLSNRPKGTGDANTPGQPCQASIQLSANGFDISPRGREVTVEIDDLVQTLDPRQGGDYTPVYGVSPGYRTATWKLVPQGTGNYQVDVVVNGATNSRGVNVIDTLGMGIGELRLLTLATRCVSPLLLLPGAFLLLQALLRRTHAWVVSRRTLSPRTAEGVLDGDGLALYDVLSGPRVSLTDLEDISMRGSVDWGDLEGNDKRAKAGSLVRWFSGRQRLPDLVKAVAESRPDLQPLLPALPANKV